MKQLDLTAAVPATGTVRAAAQATPEKAAPHANVPAKLLHITDAALGAGYTVAIGPESPWFELLPKQQSCTVTRHAAEPAHTTA